MQQIGFGTQNGFGTAIFIFNLTVTNAHVPVNMSNNGWLCVDVAANKYYLRYWL